MFVYFFFVCSYSENCLTPCEMEMEKNFLELRVEKAFCVKNF